MNDKSKHKSIIMALAVFAALAVLSAPLIADNSNTDASLPAGDADFSMPVLSNGDDTIEWTTVSSFEELMDAIDTKVPYIMLDEDINEDLTIETRKFSSEDPTDVIDQGKAITLNYDLTLDLNNKTVVINHIGTGATVNNSNRFVVCDSEESGSANVTIQNGTINFTGNDNSGKSPISVNDNSSLYMKNVNIDSTAYGVGIFDNGTLSVDNGNIFGEICAIATNGLNSPGAEITLTGGTYEGGIAAIFFSGGETLTVTGGVFEGATAFDIRTGNVSISNASIAATGNCSDEYAAANGPSGWGMGIAVFDHISYGDDISVNICDVTFDCAVIDLFVGMHPGSGSKSDVNIERPMYDGTANDNITISIGSGSTGFTYEITEGDAPIGGFITDINFDKDRILLSNVHASGTLSYVDENGKTSSITNAKVDSIETGSLLINGEITNFSPNEEVFVSGDIVIEGSLEDGARLVILPAKVENDVVVERSNVIFRNLELGEDAAVEYRISEDAESSIDAIDIADVQEIKTDAAGNETSSKKYVTDGVTVTVSDLIYNGLQYADVNILQHIVPGENNINALHTIIYYAPNGEMIKTYSIKEFGKGINENGIYAGAKTLSGDVWGFTDLQITNAGTYELIYSVTTDKIQESGTTTDEDFTVEFSVTPKVISSVLGWPVKIYDGTTAVNIDLTPVGVISGDKVTVSGTYYSSDAGVWPVIIELIGDDADNYVFSGLYKYDAAEWVFEDETWKETGSYLCWGLIIPSTIDKNDIEITNAFMPLDGKSSYPVITIRGIHDEIIATVDTSNLHNAEFDGYFLDENNEVIEFDEGLKSGNYRLILVSLNYEKYPELKNYMVGNSVYPVGLAGYVDAEALIEFIPTEDLVEAFKDLIDNDSLTAENIISLLVEKEIIAGDALEDSEISSALEYFEEVIDAVLYRLLDYENKSGSENEYDEIANIELNIITNILGLFATQPSVNDTIDQTIYSIFVLADDSYEELWGYMYYTATEDAEGMYPHKLHLDEDWIFSEKFENTKTGLKAWYTSFKDQLKGADVELKKGYYTMQIVGFNDDNNSEPSAYSGSLLTSYTIYISGENTFFDETEFTRAPAQTGILAEDGKYLSLIDLYHDYGLMINLGGDFVPNSDAWASKADFEVAEGIMIVYHYIHQNGDEQHIEYIINSKYLGVYLLSMPGPCPEGTIFVEWSTEALVLYPEDCKITSIEKPFTFNAGQAIDKYNLEKYAVDGIFNIYAAYKNVAGSEDIPEESKSLNDVSSGYSHFSSDAKGLMALYGVNVDDAVNKTAWVIYDLNGYENSEMKGILYKLVDGELVEIFSENLKSNDGRRAWYFSFLDQASAVSEYGGYVGQYMIHITADDNTILEKSLTIHDAYYSAEVSADYAVGESDRDAIIISVEPRHGAIVPKGEITVVYTYGDVDFDGAIESKSGQISGIEVPESSVTVSYYEYVPTENLEAAYAVFSWTFGDITVYSVSNVISPVGLSETEKI